MKLNFKLCIIIFQMLITSDAFTQNKKSFVKKSTDTLYSSIIINSKKSTPILIPYRDKDKWGLCDTNGNIILNPKYKDVNVDFVSNTSYLELGHLKQICYSRDVVDGFFIFNQNGKLGLLKNENVILPAEYSDIRLEENTFILADKNDEPDRFLFNLNGEMLLKEKISYVNEIYTNKLNKNEALFIIEGDKQNGVIVYNYNSKKIVQWLYKSNKSAYYKVEHYYKNNFILSVYINSSFKYFTLTKNKSKSGTFYSLNLVSEKFVSEKLGNDYFDDSDAPITDQQEFNNKYVNETNMTKSFVSKLYNDHSIFVRSFLYKSENSETALRKDTTLHKFLCDSIKEFKIDHEVNIETEKNKLKLVNYKYYNYFLVWHKNLAQIFVENNLIKDKFSRVKYLKLQDCKPYFLVSQLDSNGIEKWGIINADGNYILPCIFENIKYGLNLNGYTSHTYFIVRKEKKEGLVNYKGVEILKPKYDEIISTKEDWYLYFHLKQNNKFGFFDANNLIEPNYPYRLDINFEKLINGYNLLRAVNEKGEFIGYMNINGKLYFND